MHIYPYVDDVRNTQQALLQRCALTSIADAAVGLDCQCNVCVSALLCLFSQLNKVAETSVKLCLLHVDLFISRTEVKMQYFS